MKNLFRKFNLHQGKHGSAITIHLLPGALQKRFTDVLADGTLVLEMDIKEVSGKANQILIKYLAGLLNVAVDDIEVVAGKDGADKLVSILNQDTHILHQKIMAFIEK